VRPRAWCQRRHHASALPCTARNKGKAQGFQFRLQQKNEKTKFGTPELCFGKRAKPKGFQKRDTLALSHRWGGCWSRVIWSTVGWNDRTRFGGRKGPFDAFFLCHVPSAETWIKRMGKPSECLLACEQAKMSMWVQSKTSTNIFKKIHTKTKKNKKKTRKGSMASTSTRHSDGGATPRAFSSRPQGPTHPLTQLFRGNFLPQLYD